MADGTHRDVIIMPAHNRRATTLEALRALAADGVPAWATVLVVDDGSTDETESAIRQEHPETAVLRGDGTWWWCGAIRRGMEWALARGAERMFWLNDDFRVGAGMLMTLREFATREHCVAWIEARTISGWTYGAHHKTLWSVRRCTPAEVADGTIDSFSGNCVCLPRAWIERIGLPDDRRFPHGLGDLDYGLRLRAQGAKLRQVPGLIATNADPLPASAESWLASSRPMIDIWHDFSSPRSFLYFPAWRHFALRHWGPVWGWVVFSAPYLRWAAIAVLRATAPGLARRVAARHRAK